MVLIADSLVEVTAPISTDFTADAALAEVLTVVGKCRTDLDTPIERHGALIDAMPGRCPGPMGLA